MRIRSKLQYVQVHHNNTEHHREREEAYGEAYAIMHSVADIEIQSLASQVMDGSPQNDQGRNEKLAAIDKAIELIGKRVIAVQRGQAY